MRPDQPRCELPLIPRVQTPSLPVRIWYRRHLIVAGVVLPAVLVWLGVQIHPAVPLALGSSVALALLTVAEFRAWVLGRIRCAVMPGRVRAAFQRGRICAPDGRMPTIWWTAPLTSGVRMWVRLPIGMQPDHLERERELIAGAAGADQVFIVTTPPNRTVVVGLLFAADRWWRR